MKEFLLDTHVWLWYVGGEKSIPPKIRTLLEEGAKESCLYLASISLWEVAMLEKRASITLERETSEWIEHTLLASHVEVVHLTPKIAAESCRLNNFHGDSADRLITATARIQGLTLLTRDKQILQYAKSNHLGVLKI